MVVVAIGRSLVPPVRTSAVLLLYVALRLGFGVLRFTLYVLRVNTISFPMFIYYVMCFSPCACCFVPRGISSRCCHSSVTPPLLSLHAIHLHPYLARLTRLPDIGAWGHHMDGMGVQPLADR